MPHKTISCIVCKNQFPTEQVIGGRLVKNSNNNIRLIGKCPKGHNITRKISKADVEDAIIDGKGFISGLLP